MLVRYALAGGMLVVVGAVAAGLLGGGEVGRAVWVGGVVAWVVQVVAFGMLQRVWGSTQQFMVGWVSGMLLRMVVVVAAALVVTRTGGLAPAPMLVSLVAFMFVMVLLEPAFLKKKGTRSA